MGLQRPHDRLGITSAEHYEIFQRALITQNRVQATARGMKVGPWSGGTFRDPFDATEAPRVYVGAGIWLVRCPCGDAPALSPEWAVARCCWCGRVWRDIVMPDGWEEAEAILLRRAMANRQNWLPPETLDELRAENIAYGVDVDPNPPADNSAVLAAEIKDHEAAIEHKRAMLAQLETGRGARAIDVDEQTETP